MVGRLRGLLAWTPAVLLVPAAMAGAIALAQPDDANSALTLIAPLELGTTAVYAVSDHGKPSGTHTKQVDTRAGVDFDRLDDVTVASTYTDYPGRGPLSNLTYLGVDDDTLVQDGYRQDAQFVALDPPAPVYELPLDEGRSWSYDGLFGAAGLTYDATIEDIVDVEVGGRQFTNCIHVVTRLEFSFEGGGGDKETIEEWTCPGYGQVRTTDSIPAQDIEITEELIEFHGASGNWFAEAPRPVVAEAQAGDTLGFDSGRTRSVDGSLTQDLAWSDLRSADIAYPPVSDGEVMVLGEDDGLVSGMDVDSGQMLWRRQVTAPVIAPTTVGGGRVLVADSLKNLWAFDTLDGSTHWVHQFDDVVSTTPTVTGDLVVVVTDDGLVTALALTDGRVLWEYDLGGRTRSAPAVTGDLVVVPDLNGRIVALDLENGDKRWTRSLDGGLAAGPAASDDRVLVADDQGVVYALAAADGGLEWETRTRWDPQGDIAVSDDAVTLLGGPERLESFDLADGHNVWSVEIEDTSQSPVVVGAEVVTVSRSGTVSLRDLGDGRETRSWPLPGGGPGSNVVNVDVPLGLVHGSLVVGTEFIAAAQTTALYAYPVAEDAKRSGVAFGSEVRTLDAPPMSPPALTGDTLFVPANDYSVYRSTGSKEVEKVATSKGLLPGVAVGGGLMVTQIDDEVRGYPVAGGDPLWRFPAQPPVPGSTPVIGDGVVFVPEYGVGLAAVSTDGAPQWFTPIDNSLGTTPPLPLPGGDVFYGSGSASRYDGDTGDRRWSIDDAQLFSGASYSNGLIFADLVRNTQSSGLAAIDADTGRIRWFHENFSNAPYSGPAAADGVVVYGDSRGLVIAFAAATGKELWRLQLSTPMAGPPAIVDGRVYLAESGRNEDVFQRDYRMSVHDLHTGDFLGSYQPPGTAFFTIVPSFAASADGRLLLPSTGREGSIVVILEPHR